jgi:hypothetical protein
MSIQISGKVTAATVATGLSTLVFSIVAPHVGGGQISPDIEGLVESVITAGVTFAAGYAAKHRIPEVVEKEVQTFIGGAAPVPASAGDQPVA